MKVVLDTNVLISAYVFPGGNPEAAYRLVLGGAVELVTSRPLLAEFGRELEGKFGWEPSKSEEAVRQVARLAALAEPGERLAIVAEDPADDRVLGAAIAGPAAYIVSGDRHPLDLGSFGVRIITATAFLELAANPGQKDLIRQGDQNEERADATPTY